MKPKHDIISPIDLCALPNKPMKGNDNGECHFYPPPRCAVAMVCGQDRDGKSALKIGGVNSPATALSPLSLAWNEGC